MSKVPPTMGERRERLGVAGRAQIPGEWEETVAACLAKDREALLVFYDLDEAKLAEARDATAASGAR